MPYGKKRFSIILSLSAMLVIAFIWSQSLLNAEKSVRESGAFTEQVMRPLVSTLFGSSAARKITNGLVRKLAHIAEYTLLGLVFGASCKGRSRFIKALAAGIAVAALDECIQRFTGRGAKISDVLLDTAGVLLGNLASLMFRRIKKAANRVSQKA